MRTLIIIFASLLLLSARTNKIPFVDPVISGSFEVRINDSILTSINAQPIPEFLLDSLSPTDTLFILYRADKPCPECKAEVCAWQMEECIDANEMKGFGLNQPFQFPGKHSK